MKLLLIKITIWALLILAGSAFVLLFELPTEWPFIAGIAVRVGLAALSFASYRLAERIYKGNLATGK